MITARPRRVRRLLVRAGLVVLALLLLSAAWFVPRAGRYLIVEAPLEKSDAIIVLAGARAERWLESVDLFREGWAPRIVLSPGRTEEAEVRIRQMGVRFPSETELIRDAMVQMHVPAEAVLILSDEVDNTAQEASAAREMALKESWRRIIVVTSKYHTRRTAFAFEREVRGTGIRVLVRANRYDAAAPDRWWASRADFRFVTSELQKLLAYRLGLGG
jgi:uncharacterized SAM-binding protein YcdF (DUF218 family)